MKGEVQLLFSTYFLFAPKKGCSFRFPSLSAGSFDKLMLSHTLGVAANSISKEDSDTLFFLDTAVVGSCKTCWSSGLPLSFGTWTWIVKLY